MKPIFSKLIILILLSSSGIVTASTDSEFTENAQYKRVSNGKIFAKKTTDKIEITEFFLYSCPHCFQLEPKLEQWIEKNQDKVILKRVPAVVSSSWIPLAKAFYIAQKLKVIEQTHDALFKSIHLDKKVYLNEYSLAIFFEDFGIPRAQFMQEFNATDIIEKVSQARIATVNYNFRGVPAVVLNNEYKTAPFYTKNQEEMLKVMDFLLTKIIANKQENK